MLNIEDLVGQSPSTVPMLSIGDLVKVNQMSISGISTSKPEVYLEFGSRIPRFLGNKSTLTISCNEPTKVDFIGKIVTIFNNVVYMIDTDTETSYHFGSELELVYSV